MDLAVWRRRFIKTLRIYPLLLLGLLATIYLFYTIGPLESNTEFSQNAINVAGFLFIGVVPIVAIIAFMIIGQAGDAEMKSKRLNQEKFIYGDAFEIPSEVMHGYKLAVLTGKIPMLTGLTGDTYAADASAVCTIDSEHIPPVANCECGFYAYKEREDAEFELTINPGAFLLDVDLYGIGFVYQRGYRSETQVVNNLTVRKRCARCKIFPPKVFVPVFHLSQNDYQWWQWQARCGICSSTFKESDKLDFEQMGKLLQISVKSI